MSTSTIDSIEHRINVMTAETQRLADLLREEAEVTMGTRELWEAWDLANRAAAYLRGAAFKLRVDRERKSTTGLP